MDGAERADQQSAHAAAWCRIPVCSQGHMEHRPSSAELNMRRQAHPWAQDTSHGNQLDGSMQQPAPVVREQQRTHSCNAPPPEGRHIKYVGRRECTPKWRYEQGLGPASTTQATPGSGAFSSTCTQAMTIATALLPIMLAPQVPLQFTTTCTRCMHAPLHAENSTGR